ncbi:MAG: hypothetical protein ACLGP3_05865 [Acidobacteriota bacterium]
MAASFLSLLAGKPKAGGIEPVSLDSQQAGEIVAGKLDRRLAPRTSPDAHGAAAWVGHAAAPCDPPSRLVSESRDMKHNAPSRVLD